MLRVFQRVESIHETQAMFSLEYQNIHTRYIFNINILFSLQIVFYKRIVFTHSYLMFCVRTVKDGRCKIEIRDALMSQRRSVQGEVLLSF